MNPHREDGDNSSSSSSDSALLDRTDEPSMANVLDEYLSALEAGYAPDREDLIRRYPAFADELADRLDALEFIHEAAAELSGERPRPGAAGASLSPGQQVGDFLVVREIGRGGMGIVYEAEHRALGRRVALKVLPFASLLNEKQLRRFSNEARAAATLDHPHIVPAQAIGHDAGVHYYVMELINGPSLAELIDRLRQANAEFHPPLGRDCKAGDGEPVRQRGNSAFDAGNGAELDEIPPRKRESPPTLSSSGSPSPNATAGRDPGRCCPRCQTHSADRLTDISTWPSACNQQFYQVVASLGIQAAEALAHAHAAGVIHRDIKPANLLLDQRSRLYVTDFGLARIEDDPGMTRSGDMLGTARYMSPEQVHGASAIVDRRTDIYSLGVTLYELLTLEPAFSAENRQELLNRITQGALIEPRTRNRFIPRELEAIVLTAMSNDPADRYASAQDLADDLRRYLADIPIRAKRPTPATRLAKWCRRNRAIVATIVVSLIVAMIISTTVISVAFRRERVQRQLAQQARTRAERSESRLRLLVYAADIKLAYRAWQDRDVAQMVELLDRNRPAPGERDARGFEWYYLQQLAHTDHTVLSEKRDAIYCTASAPKERLVAWSGADSTVHLLELDTLREVSHVNTGQGEVNGLAFSPEGGTLVTAGDDGTVRWWSVPNLKMTRKIRAYDDEAYAAAFAPDGSLLATCSNEPTIRLWDPRTGALLGSLEGHQRAVESLAFSPDGRVLASASSDKTARLWDVNSRRLLQVLAGHTDRLTSIAFSPDGKRVATGSIDKTLRVWDTASGRCLALTRHLDKIQSVIYLAGGNCLAAGDRGGAIRLWKFDHGEGRLERVLQAHASRVYSLCPAGGDSLISGGQDGRLVLWSLASASSTSRVQLPGYTEDFVFIADGSVLAAGGSCGMTLVDIASQSVPFRLPDADVACQSVAASLSGRMLAAVTRNKSVRVWDLSDEKMRAAWPVGTWVHAHELAFAPDASFLAIPDWNRSPAAVLCLDADSGEIVHSFSAVNANAIAISRDGNRLAADSENGILVWDLATHRLCGTLRGHTSTVEAIAFSPDGQLLASAGRDRLVCIWEAGTGRRRYCLNGHRDDVWTLAFAPDGRSLVTADESGTVKFWQVDAGRELLSLQVAQTGIDKIAFSPDGSRLAYLLDDGTVHLLHVLH